MVVKLFQGKSSVLCFAFNKLTKQNIFLHILVYRKKHRDTACWNERHLNNNSINGDAKLRINRHAGKENVHHKPAIEALLIFYWEEPYVVLHFSKPGANVKRGPARPSPRTMPMAESTRSWPMKKPQKTITAVKTASPRLNEKRGFIALEQMMMSLPVRSCFICSKTKSILHSVLLRDKGRHRWHRLVRKQTTWSSQVERNDENYIEGLSTRQ